MGKGKAKGFRPPRGDDPNMGMLYGSAAHLTGDTIASPVQLRQEGRELPPGHLNFGDEWGKGTGKGGKGADSATGSNLLPVRPKAAEGAPLMPAASKAKPAAPAAEPSASSGCGSNGDAPSAAMPPPKEVPKKEVQPTPAPKASQPTASSGLSEIERRRAAMTEIERRRAEMLERERASGHAAGATGGGLAAALCKAEPAGDESMLCKEEDDAAQEEPEEEEEDEVQRAIARRRRLEEEGGEPADAAEEDRSSKRPRTEGGAAGQQEAGAIKQGLQQWAESVNALASDGADEDLVVKCRDFVRKRILRAHAEGNLHSVDWGTEPVPTVEELRATP